MKRLKSLGQFSLFCLVLACPATAEDNPVAAGMMAMVSAYNAADAGAVAELYTEDAALLPPQSGNIIGRKAIAEHYEAAFRLGVSGLEVNILEIRQLGETSAVMIGETRVALGTQRILGRFMHVWFREPDGTWRINRDIYNVIGTQ